MKIGKFLIFLFAGFVFVACLLTATASFYFPAILKYQLKEAFAGLGFTDIEIGKIVIGENKIIFSDITLDNDGFSTLKSISVTYNWQTVTTEGKFDNLHLDGMTLTAILESNGDFSMAGWSIPAFEPFVMPVKTISFSNIILDVDTIHGAIRFQSEGNGIVDDKGNADIQALVWGEQNQLQIKSTFNGSFNPNGTWALDCQIDEGRLNLTDITASRLGGWISMGMQEPSGQIRLGGQLAAGMLSFGSMPFQNVVAVLNGTPQAYRIIVDGTGGGSRSLNFHIEFGEEKNTFFGQGRINVGNSADLASFITASTLSDSVSPVTLYIAALPPMTVNLAYLDDQSKGKMHHPIFLELSDQNNLINMSSLIEIDLQKKALLGSFSLPRTSLPDISRTIPLAKIAGFDITKGYIKADGHYFIDFQAENPSLEGPLEIELTDIAGGNDKLQISGLGGKMNFSTLKPLISSGKQTITIETINSILPLSKGRITYDLKGDGNLNLDGASAVFAGGKIMLSPMQISFGSPSTDLPATIKFEKIDLTKFAELTGLDKSVSITGKLNGEVSLNTAKNKIEIRNGLLRTHPPGGHIRYNPETYPAFLSGNDTRMEIVRGAITYFDYDEISIKFSGPLFGEMQAGMEARGYNRKVFGDRPVHLNLNLEGALPVLLTGTTNY